MEVIVNKSPKRRPKGQTVEVKIWNTPETILCEDEKRIAFERAIQKAVAESTNLPTTSICVRAFGFTQCGCRTPGKTRGDHTCIGGQIAVVVSPSNLITHHGVQRIALNVAIEINEGVACLTPIYDSFTKLFTSALSTLMWGWYKGQARPFLR